jgi:hypothetical protein
MRNKVKALQWDTRQTFRWKEVRLTSIVRHTELK